MQLKTKIQVYLELSISVSVWLSIWSFWIQGHTIIGISIEGSFEKAAIQMLIVPIYWAKKKSLGNLQHTQSWELLRGQQDLEVNGSSER